MNVAEFLREVVRGPQPGELCPGRKTLRALNLRLLPSLYSLGWLLARPVLRRHHRLREGFDWRLVPEGWAGGAASGESPAPEALAPEAPGETQTSPSGPFDLWIQAASGGEAWLAAEILRDLAAEHPGLKVLATTWTRQGLEVLHGTARRLRQDFPEMAVRVTFFPLDQPAIMARALDQARPRLVALLETELWPGLMLAAQARQIPVLVLNGRMTPKSLRGYALIDTICPWFWRGLVSAVNAISPADARRFAALFTEETVSVAPNIKFDRCLPPSPGGTSAGAGGGSGSGSVAAPPVPDLPEGLRVRLAGSPVVLLASVRQEEEEACVRLIRYLRHEARGLSPIVVVAPRHMHRVPAWRERLDAFLANEKGKNGCACRLRSELAASGPETTGDSIEPGTGSIARSALPGGSIVLWDAFGELSALYALADAVFVGGSLAPLGGQNFLEALTFGRVPCCGPHLDNFAWALDSAESAGTGGLVDQGLLRVRRTPEELALQLIELLRAPTPPDAVRARFRRWLTPHLGGTAASVALIDRCLAGDAPQA